MVIYHTTYLKQRYFAGTQFSALSNNVSMPIPFFPSVSSQWKKTLNFTQNTFLKKEPYRHLRASVIIPTLNEEKYLPTTLKLLRLQDIKDFEIIVVDGHSSDKTVEIAEKYADKVIISERGISKQRNIGAKYAKNEILLFTDADAIIPPDWVRTTLTLFEQDATLLCACGRVHPHRQASVFLRIAYFWADIVKFFLHRTGIMLAAGCNMAVRKSAFKKIGGFDESLQTREDLEFATRLAKYGKVDFFSNLIVWTSDRRKKGGVFRLLNYYIDNLRFLLFRTALPYIGYR